MEFTHNSNLHRMIALLESSQLSVVSPMTEDATTNELSSHCFDVCSDHSNGRLNDDPRERDD